MCHKSESLHGLIVIVLSSFEKVEDNRGEKQYRFRRNGRATQNYFSIVFPGQPLKYHMALGKTGMGLAWKYTKGIKPVTRKWLERKR